MYRAISLQSILSVAAATGLGIARSRGWLMERLVSTWTPVHGLRIHARVSMTPGPDAPTVVLVHGVAVSSRYLVPLAEQLVPRARVYLPDLPGYGRSECPPRRDLDVPE